MEGRVNKKNLFESCRNSENQCFSLVFPHTKLPWQISWLGSDWLGFSGGTKTGECGSRRPGSRSSWRCRAISGPLFSVEH